MGAPAAATARSFRWKVAGLSRVLSDVRPELRTSLSSSSGSLWAPSHASQCTICNHVASVGRLFLAMRAFIRVPHKLKTRRRWKQSCPLCRGLSLLYFCSWLIRAVLHSCRHFGSVFPSCIHSPVAIHRPLYADSVCSRPFIIHHDMQSSARSVRSLVIICPYLWEEWHFKVPIMSVASSFGSVASSVDIEDVRKQFGDIRTIAAEAESLLRKPCGSFDDRRSVCRGTLCTGGTPAVRLADVFGAKFVSKGLVRGKQCCQDGHSPEHGVCSKFKIQCQW